MAKIILYNFASRSRPDKFIRAVANIQAITQQPYKILAKLDLDDESMQQFQGKLPHIDVAWGWSANKIEAINRNIPEEGWDILVNMSDDMELHGNFSEVVREHCDLDTFLHIPDQYAQHHLCTLSIIGRDYYMRDRYIYHPSYYSLWCDNEAQTVAQNRGCYKFLDIRGLIVHKHYAPGLTTKDALYIRNDTYSTDANNFRSRLAAGFPA